MVAVLFGAQSRQDSTLWSGDGSVATRRRYRCRRTTTTRRSGSREAIKNDGGSAILLEISFSTDSLGKARKFSMNEKYNGSCLCGAINYECTGEPIFSGNCHCTDCQKSSGSGYVPALMFPASAVKIFGSPNYFEKNGDSGKKIQRGFCSSCGSTVFGTFEAIPNVIGVRAGTLNNPSLYEPKLDFYTGSASHWDFMNEKIPKLKKSVREG